MSALLVFLIAAHVAALFALPTTRGLGRLIQGSTTLSRKLALSWVSRGLGLEQRGRTSQGHAMLGARVGEHEVQLKLGGGRLRVSVRTGRDTRGAPLAVASFYLQEQKRWHLETDDVLEFCDSTVLLDCSSDGFLLRRRNLTEVLGSLKVLVCQVEANLVDPERIAKDVQNTRLSSSLRRSLLEYLHRTFPQVSVARDAIVDALNDVDSMVRLAASRLLGSAGHPTLLALAEEPESLRANGQIELARQLVRVDSKAAQDAMLRLAEIPNPRVREVVLELLAERVEVIPLALGVFSSEAEPLGLRQKASELLASNHARERWQHVLFATLENEDEISSLREHAYYLCRRWGDRTLAHQALRRVARRPSRIRAWAIGQLAQSLGERVRDELIEIAREDPSARVPVLLVFDHLGRGGVDFLIECLESESRLVLEHAVRGLEDQRAARALPALKALRSRLGIRFDRRLTGAVTRAITSIERGLPAARERSGGALTVCAVEDTRGELAFAQDGGLAIEAEP